MYNFEDLRKEGKNAIGEWHKRKYKYDDLMGMIPSVNNGFKIDPKDLEGAFPEIVMAMKNSPQEPEFHFEGDVWTHTMMVMDAMFESDYYQNSSFNEQQILFWSAFLHDVAKPMTVDLNLENDKISNKNHSVRGAEVLRLFMWNNGFDREMREHIAKIIRYHQKPFHWAKYASEFQIRAWSQELSIERLLTVARADLKGRILKHDHKRTTKKVMSDLELLEYCAVENDCLNKPWQHNFKNVKAKKIYFDANGGSYEDRPVFEKKGSDVVFLIGLPASGKDHWISNFGENRPTVSCDDERKRLKLKSGNDGQAVQAVKEKTKKLLRNKEPFIFNATNIHEDLRQKHLNLLNDYNATIRIVYLEGSMSELLERNKERNNSIPPNKILQMAEKWTPPSSIEGHEVLWWDKNKGTPIYRDFLTSSKDCGENAWSFIKNK